MIELPANMTGSYSSPSRSIKPLAKRAIEVEEDDVLDIRSEVTGNLEACKVKPLPPSVVKKSNTSSSIEYLAPDVGTTNRFYDEDEYA